MSVSLFQRPQTLDSGPSPLPHDLIPTNGLTVTLVDSGEHYSAHTGVGKMGDSSQAWQWRSQVHVEHTARFLSLRAFCLSSAKLRPMTLALQVYKHH